MTPDLLLKVFGDKWLRLVVMLLVLAALAHQVSLVVWQFVPAPGPVAAMQRVEVALANTAGNSGASFQQQANAISREFLFGKPEVIKTVAVVVATCST